MAALLSNTHMATLTSRERDLLRLRTLEYGEELSRLIVPLHESVGRSKPHRLGYVNALVPHSLLFHGKRMRLLLGWGHFKIQMGLSSEAAMDISGEDEGAPQSGGSRQDAPHAAGEILMTGIGRVIFSRFIRAAHRLL